MKILPSPSDVWMISVQKRGYKEEFWGKNVFLNQEFAIGFFKDKKEYILG